MLVSNKLFNFESFVFGQARESISNKLELRFRPEDPYAHPALGEQRLCNGFLLKISKKDIKKPVLATSDVCLEEASPALCADIVAHVSESFHFDGKHLALLFLLDSYASDICLLCES